MVMNLRFFYIGNNALLLLPLVRLEIAKISWPLRNTLVVVPFFILCMAFSITMYPYAASTRKSYDGNILSDNM